MNGISMLILSVGGIIAVLFFVSLRKVTGSTFCWKAAVLPLF